MQAIRILDGLFSRIHRRAGVCKNGDMVTQTPTEAEKQIGARIVQACIDMGWSDKALRKQLYELLREPLGWKSLDSAYKIMRGETTRQWAQLAVMCELLKTSPDVILGFKPQTCIPNAPTTTPAPSEEVLAKLAGLLTAMFKATGQTREAAEAYALFALATAGLKLNADTPLPDPRQSEAEAAALMSLTNRSRR